MTNEQLIEKFNPQNGANLTAEDLEVLHSLTDEQIDVLAKAYPNQPNRRAYLRLYDKNAAPNKQLYNLSTWQNIRNLRKFNAKKNLIPWDFFNVTAAAAAVTKNTQTIPGAKSPRKVVVDMTAKEAAAELANQTAVPIKPVKPAAKKATAKTAAPTVETPANVTAEGGAPADQDFTDGQG
jgi:hypothetical protein